MRGRHSLQLAPVVPWYYAILVQFFSVGTVLLLPGLRFAGVGMYDETNLGLAFPCAMDWCGGKVLEDFAA